MKPIAILFSLAAFCLSMQFAQAENLASPSKVDQHRSIYAVRYERYGVFGIYHVGLVADLIRDGVHICKLHIDGAGRLPKYEIPLGFGELKFRFLPVFLSGSVNPRGYKKHFLGLLSSEEFGPTYILSEQQGARLVSLAHHAITDINSGDRLLYCTLPFQLGPLGFPGFQIGPQLGPFKIGMLKIPAFQMMGPINFWTSNSVVASLIDIANKEGIHIPKPSKGTYPGFDGPFLPKSLYEYDKGRTSSYSTPPSKL